jgi:hypothetical protein
MVIGVSVAKTFADLVVYQSAFRAALAVFEASKSFPKEECFALTAPGADNRNVVREDADDVDDSLFTSHQSPSA